MKNTLSGLMMFLISSMAYAADAPSTDTVSGNEQPASNAMNTNDAEVQTQAGPPVNEPAEAPMPKIATQPVAPVLNPKGKGKASSHNDSQKALSSRKLEFDDQSVNALDPDYGKLDLTSIRDGEAGSGRLYPIRKSFKREQQDAVRNWGIGE